MEYGRGERAQNLDATSDDEIGVPCEKRFPQLAALGGDDAETPLLPPSAIRAQFEVLLRRHHRELLTQLESCLSAVDACTLDASAGFRRGAGVISGTSELQKPQSLDQPAQPDGNSLDGKQSLAAAVALQVESDPHLCFSAADACTLGVSAGLRTNDVVISGTVELQEPQTWDQPVQPVGNILGDKQSLAAAVALLAESDPHQQVAERAASEDTVEAHKESSRLITSYASPKSAQRANSSIMHSSSDQQLRHPRGHRIMKSTACEGLVTSVVLLNAAFIGLQVQVSALQRGRPLPESMKSGFFMTEATFAGIFSVELLMRIWVDRLDFIWSPDWRWNLFDSFILALMLLQLVAELAASSLDTSVTDHPALRVLRVCRLVRLLRIVKLLRSLRELRIMVASILSSLKPLCWVCLLFLMILYVVGITLTVGTVEHLSETETWDHEESATLIHHFASLDATVLSLFEAMTGGISWGELFDATQVLQPMYPALFLSFMVFTLLGLLNVVTGVFVDSAMGHSREDAETIIQEELEAKKENLEKLRLLFQDIDTEERGSISREQLKEAFSDERMEAFLHRMGLSTDNAENLFVLLDRDHEGEVDTDEFLQGCLKLLGQATSLEIAQISLENRWMLQNITNLVQLVNGLGEKLAGRAS